MVSKLYPFFRTEIGHENLNQTFVFERLNAGNRELMRSIVLRTGSIHFRKQSASEISPTAAHCFKSNFNLQNRKEGALTLKV